MGPLSAFAVVYLPAGIDTGIGAEFPNVSGGFVLVALRHLWQTRSQSRALRVRRRVRACIRAFVWPWFLSLDSSGPSLRLPWAVDRLRQRAPLKLLQAPSP